MTIQIKINNDIKKAMKARNTDQLAALRAAKSAIMLEATKDGISSVSDDVVLNIISKLVKQRNDSAHIYNEQGRKDLAQDELNQINYLIPYLPKQLKEEEIRVLVQEAIIELKADSLSDIGRCMSYLTNKLKGRADGKIISSIVRNELNNK